MSRSPEFDSVRSELRRLGYLDHGVERFLLQDAMRPERPLRTLLQLTTKVGLLAGVPAALISTLLLAAINGNFRASPFDVVPLFLHVLLPIALIVAVAFATLGGLLVLVLRWSHARKIETVSFAMAAVSTALMILFAVWRGRSYLAEIASWQLVGWFLTIPIGAFLAVKVIHGGLLSLAIRLTDLPPEKPSSRLPWIVLTMTLAAFLLLLPTILDVQHSPLTPPPSLPMTPEERVLLIGIDGVLPQELASLLAADELPAMRQRLENGGALLRYPRSEEPPGSFWTTIATGLDSAQHGMESLDSFRPVGVHWPLRRSGWLRGYWSHVGVPGGWVEHRPVLAQNRRAYAIWELAARGGGPVLVVDWWGTFPAVELPGLLVAHGAYQLLDNDAASAVQPESALIQVRQKLGEQPPQTLKRSLRAALDEPTVADLLDKAIRPDLLYRRVFEDGLSLRPRAALLYLPALDIAADIADPGSVAQGDLVRWQLHEVDALLREHGDAFSTVLLIFDPGRRGSDQGRALLWSKRGCAGSETKLVSPRALTSAMLRALGLPQSQELAEPPDMCDWPAPSLVVETFGERRSEESAQGGTEYLENLRSLGYL